MSEALQQDVPLGARYRVLVPTRPRRDALLRFFAGLTGQAEDPRLLVLREAVHGRVAIAFEDGGLLQWLDAWHNAVLPANYHAAESVRQARRRARGIFAALGQDPDAIAGKPIDELSLLQARLVGFVKAMLLEPGLLVLDCLFERLGFEEQRQVAGWIEYCRKRYPMRRMLYVGLTQASAALLDGFEELDAMEKA